MENGLALLGGGGKWEYYRLGDQDTHFIWTSVCDAAQVVHVQAATYSYITSVKNKSIQKVTKIACQNNTYVYADNHDTFRVYDTDSWKKNFCDGFEISEEDFDNYLFPITKEEFYTLEFSDGTVQPLL